MIYIVVWLASGAIGYAIGNTKGRAGLGAALGLLLGVIGVIIIAVMKPAAGYQGASAGSAPFGQMAGAGWQPDPYRRHELRYWNGGAWTDSVSDHGEQTVDGHGAMP